jgi:hypothetical protein
MLDAMFDFPSEKKKKSFKLTLSYAKSKLDNSTLVKLRAA